jgi:hypothetical protein
MIIHNHLPLLHDCLRRWKNLPTEKQFSQEYAEPMSTTTGDFFEGFREVLEDLDWNAYRTEALTLDAIREEKRIRKNLQKVEDLFQFQLEGEVILMGAFTAMDGYARFDRGTHKVFLGVDESHGRGLYLDILMTHELTHVARESRPEVWEGFGLNPKMTQDEFTSSQPVIEHLMGEGFSCAVSEILVPGQAPWEYAYQSEKSLKQVYKNGRSIDQMIRHELKKSNGNYGHLYGVEPLYAHYVWAWQWVKTLLAKYAGGDAKKLVARCSQDFLADALEFRLNG